MLTVGITQVDDPRDERDTEHEDHHHTHVHVDPADIEHREQDEQANHAHA